MASLDKRVKITMCADGFVSICGTELKRRLNAGIPIHSTDSVEEALALINKCCVLKPCKHGGKTGTIVEPWFYSPNQGEYTALGEASEAFQQADCIGSECLGSPPGMY